MGRWMEAASSSGGDRGSDGGWKQRAAGVGIEAAAVEEQQRTVQLGTEEASDVVVEGSSDPDRPSDANSGADWFVQFGGATCCCWVLMDGLMTDEGAHKRRGEWTGYVMGEGKHMIIWFLDDPPAATANPPPPPLYPPRD
uniref:DUF834 domain-containing protein n=1 Tax=Oryza rufipogon TaxID=4529 RepID=A0A0E0Q892_ORYRU